MTKHPLKVITHQDDFVVLEKPENVSFHDEDMVGSG